MGKFVIDAADFINFDLHYSLAFGVGDSVPFAGCAHSEDHVRSVAVLDYVADNSALFILNHLAGVIQNCDDRDIQPRFWSVVHLLFHKTQKKKLSDPRRRVNVRAPNDGVNSRAGSRPISTSRSRVISRNSGLFWRNQATTSSPS